MSGLGATAFGEDALGGTGAGGTYEEDLEATAVGVETFLSSSIYRALSASAGASDALTYREYSTLTSLATATDSVSSLLEMYNILLNVAEATDVLVQVNRGVLADSAGAADALLNIYKQIGRLTDIAAATDPLVTKMTAAMSLLSTAVTVDLLGRGYDNSLLSTAAAATTIAETLQGLAVLLDNAMAADSVGSYLRVYVNLSDSGIGTDAVAARAELLELLESGANAAVVLRIGGEEYSAWVLNTDNLALSQYDNFGFNSMAEFNGRHYGAREDGLYLFGGDDDAGAAISARFKTGITDLGTGSVKRSPILYVGYTSDGDLVLKVITTSRQGAKTQHWYRLTERREAGGTRDNRVKAGKGLASVYFQYELENIDGADFAFETIRLWPMTLSRRIR